MRDVLPSPVHPGERSRYGYRYSVQIELSDTRVFDRPAAGRAWFEQTIRDQLDLGRPDKIQIMFDRKVTSRTPGAGSKRRSSAKASSRSSKRTTSIPRSSSQLQACNCAPDPTTLTRLVAPSA